MDGTLLGVAEPGQCVPQQVIEHVDLPLAEVRPPRWDPQGIRVRVDDPNSRHMLLEPRIRVETTELDAAKGFPARILNQILVPNREEVATRKGLRFLADVGDQ